MARPAILDAFASHAFLERLDDRCLMDLASGARPFSAAAGGYIARKGQPATALYLVQSGTASVGLEDGPDLTRLLTIGPGGVIGWSWLVPPHRWQFTCKADGPVSGLMFDAAWLRDRCEQNHELGYHLLKELITNVTQQLTAIREHTAVAAQSV
ncbi:MAG TPA: cyclic nucleotide-binding domain-containing protein [Fimbriiglobus sp.]|jgi:CRP-like cAMP-binding protein|nr:cyclic nucleotide-binding domain-containing protein [Fimbriiglobus sp.]